MIKQADSVRPVDEAVRTFQRELTAAARLRWGDQRATDLVEPIAQMAQALADLTGASFAHDDAEPDGADSVPEFLITRRST